MHPSNPLRLPEPLGDECYDMNEEISAAIIKLKANAPDVVFTGFMTNAFVVPPAMLKGEVWSHMRADATGAFADGHRIETSDIVRIHARGESLWVTTRSGSVYGILTFTSLGWTFFAAFYQAHFSLDLVPPGSPTFHMRLPPEPTVGLAKRLRPKPISEVLPQSQVSLKRKPMRPEADTKYMERMDYFIKETREVLIKNGVHLPRIKS